MKKWKKVLLACIMAGSSLTGSCFAAPIESAQSQITKDIRTQEILGNQFRSGFYYYKTHPRFNASPEEISADIDKMADLGFNYVHVNIQVTEGKVDYPELNNLLETCSKRNMAVIIQLTGAAYLRNALAGRHTDQFKKGWDLQRVVNAAVPVIKKYHNNPHVVGFSAQEEPDEEILSLLEEYHQAILKEIPNVNIRLLYNVLDVAVKDKNSYPTLSSHDNYPFKRSYVLDKYNMRSPGFAIKIYTAQIDAFQQMAQSKGQAFEAAFSGWTRQLTLDKNFEKGRHNAKIKDRNQGFSLGEDKRILLWNNYRPPTNYVSAMCWIALSKGADALANWSWAGVSIDEKKGTKMANTLGWDNKGSRILDEYSAFAKTIRPFGKLMRSVSRDITSFTVPPNKGDIIPIAPAKNPILQVSDDSDIVWDSFTIPGYKGKMVVIVNTKIGTWSGGKSPLILQNDTPFHIDDQGELIDFVPFTEDREVRTKVLLPDVEATDLMTSQKIPINSDGNMKLDIAPGSGKIVFFSTEESSEAQKLMKEYGLH